MAYNYLEADNLPDALHDSEEYMKDFWAPIPELERLGRGRPGKIPKGKPKVTDGTLAGVRRELPKQIIQQLPTGTVTVKGKPELEKIANAVLTDIILPNANSGGDPYSKSQKAIKRLTDVGSAWAYCFFNRRGSLFHADYRLKHYRDVLFEQGKVSEHDCNFMMMIDWMTECDLKATIYWQKELGRMSGERGEKYKGDWDPKALQQLLDHGPQEKDEENKTRTEQGMQSSPGYFKLVKFVQIGTGATFYTYAPAIKKCVGKSISKDERGVMPLHGLVAEDDDENPLGEPLFAISAGKQNLQDFDMQMYQYGQGLQYAPPIKKWGQTKNSKIRLEPDAIINMSGSKAAGDDFEVVDLGTRASANFANNYGLIKSQILNELGRRSDSSISATSGNPGFSKTDAGVKQGATITSISDNDYRKRYEVWQGRIYETLLNIHFAESQGIKELELEAETRKRAGIAPDQTVQLDYDKPTGPIRYACDASSSQAADNERESEKLVSLLEIKAKHGQQPDEKFMLMYNQIVKNAGVDDGENLLYTDDEITFAKEQGEAQRQMLAMQQQQAMTQLQNPPQPSPQAAPEAPGQPQPNPIEEDRLLALQQLQERGMAPQQAEQVLRGIEQGTM